MGSIDALIAELRPDLEVLVGTLFDRTSVTVNTNGPSFAPHGAALTESGEFRKIEACPPGSEQERDCEAGVLHLLREALRAAARNGDVRAVATCEDATIDTEELKHTQAIRVMVEHRRGLCASFYLPYKRKWRGGYSFYPMETRPETPEIFAWWDNKA